MLERPLPAVSAQPNGSEVGSPPPLNQRPSDRILGLGRRLATRRFRSFVAQSHKPDRGAPKSAQTRHSRAATIWLMTASAPRYDPRLLRAIRRLDDESLSIAEVCRRVGAAAEKIGVPRPSYVHVRRIVLSERARAAELREIRNEALVGLVARMAPDPVDLALRRQEILARDRLRPGRPSKH